MPDFSAIATVVTSIVIALIALLIGYIVLRRTYRNAGPDEALVITGRRSGKTTVKDGVTTVESNQRIIHGQGAFVNPIFQKAHRISLHLRGIDITVEAQDQNGISLVVDAVAMVKVGDEHDDIRAASQRFLGKESNIDAFAQEVLSGSLRASIGSTTVLTIIRKRDELGSNVLQTASQSLASQGVIVDSFEIKGINDANGYIKNLGRAEEAEVRQQAEVAEHIANRSAREAGIAAEEAIAEAENKLALRKAALQLDTDKATAEAAAAKPLAEAKAQQSVVAEQEITAARRAELRKAELASEVLAVADAAAYETRVNAEASAEAARLTAQGGRDARVAAAEAVRIEGEAESAAIAAKGAAEAEATRLSAEALAQQSEALINMRMVEMLPQIAHELAAPMGNIDQLTVISTDGASQLAKNVASGFTEVDSVLQSTMGVGVKDLLAKLTGGAAAGAAALVTAGAPAAAGATGAVAHTGASAAGSSVDATLTEAARYLGASEDVLGEGIDAVNRLKNRK